MITKISSFRHTGSCALDLAYVASGKIDGYLDFARGAKAWDSSAGIILTREAGGKITEITPKNKLPTGRSVIATNGKIHAELLKNIPKSWITKSRF